jgi:UDP-N-acetyl-D-glucosamine/UDP-N-acetyl-D-galactosamine dehydrogenase
VLEESSGLKCGSDFNVAYSPERINPGDKQHRFETTQKAVAAQDERTLDVVAEVYSSVVTAGVYRAINKAPRKLPKSLKTHGEISTLLLMNELSTIFHEVNNRYLGGVRCRRNQMEFSQLCPRPCGWPLHWG